MMHVNIKALKGKLLAPPSKSHAQRLLLLSSITKSPFKIHNLGQDKDTLAMQAAMAEIKNDPSQKHKVLFLGESGFALRSLAFLGRHFYKEYTLNGAGTLKLREHRSTIHLLEQLGLKVKHSNGLLPLEISGQIQHKRLVVDGSQGSQFVSGLFFLAAATPGSWHIEIQKLSSGPYFELTLNVLAQAGFKYKQMGDTYLFEGAQELQLDQATVEGDWSSVAAFLVGAAIKGKIEIVGLNQTSLQPDRNLLRALHQFGAQMHWENGTLLINSSDKRQPFDFDCTQQPDLFPVLVVLACAAIGKSRIAGIDRLKNKESDRLKAMCEALKLWEIEYQINGNQIEIQGTGKVKSSQINTHNDHRIAMAGAIAALLCDEGQYLNENQSVTKSYPAFFEDLKALTES